MALAAYRHILRATRIAFKDDHPILHAARSQARQTFLASRTLSPLDPETIDKIAHAEQVAEILRRNVVQAERTTENEKGEERWRLRIHEDTERGDNESIKLAGKRDTSGELGRTGTRRRKRKVEEGVGGKVEAA